MDYFSRYIESLHAGLLSDRQNDIVTALCTYFDPQKGDTYYFMDPYLDVIDSIQQPFKENKIEDRIWSNLIASLANENTTFKIITREPRNISLHIAEVPYIINYYEPGNDVIIEVCKYLDTKHSNLSLHDRYILKENKDIIKGVLIGPSLENIQDKDISIVKYNSDSTKKALTSFKDIWEQCIKFKGWHKS